MEVLSFKDKKELSRDLSLAVQKCTSTLEQLISPDAENTSVKDIEALFFNLIDTINSGYCCVLEHLKYTFSNVYFF